MSELGVKAKARGAGPHWGRWAYWAILVLAAGLRGWFWLRTRNIPLWIDELYSAEWSAGRSMGHMDMPLNQPVTELVRYTHLSAARPIWEMWTGLVNDVQAPLYYVVLRGWRLLWGTVGDSNAAMRSLSVESRAYLESQPSFWLLQIFTEPGRRMEFDKFVVVEGIRIGEATIYVHMAREDTLNGPVQPRIETIEPPRN